MLLVKGVKAPCHLLTRSLRGSRVDDSDITTLERCSHGSASLILTRDKICVCARACIYCFLFCFSSSIVSGFPFTLTFTIHK